MLKEFVYMKLAGGVIGSFLSIFVLWPKTKIEAVLRFSSGVSASFMGTGRVMAFFELPSVVNGEVMHEDILLVAGAISATAWYIGGGIAKLLDSFRSNPEESVGKIRQFLRRFRGL